eukprot:5256477-Pyramimonas_sp.AAC.1
MPGSSTNSTGVAGAASSRTVPSRSTTPSATYSVPESTNFTGDNNVQLQNAQAITPYAVDCIRASLVGGVPRCTAVKSRMASSMHSGRRARMSSSFWNGVRCASSLGSGVSGFCGAGCDSHACKNRSRGANQIKRGKTEQEGQVKRPRQLMHTGHLLV